MKYIIAILFLSVPAYAQGVKPDDLAESAEVKVYESVLEDAETECTCSTSSPSQPQIIITGDYTDGACKAFNGKFHKSKMGTGGVKRLAAISGCALTVSTPIAKEKDQAVAEVPSRVHTLEQWSLDTCKAMQDYQKSMERLWSNSEVIKSIAEDALFNRREAAQSKPPVRVIEHQKIIERPVVPQITCPAVKPSKWSDPAEFPDPN